MSAVWPDGGPDAVLWFGIRPRRCPRPVSRFERGIQVPPQGRNRRVSQGRPDRSGHQRCRSGGGLEALYPSNIDRCWSVPRTGAYAEWIEEHCIPGYWWELSVLRRLNMLHVAGSNAFTLQWSVELERYLSAIPGQVPSSVWADIQPVSPQAKERVGYPTQKPLALLDRIIPASPIPGDMILDPVCGCATACVAAGRMEHQWVGIYYRRSRHDSPKPACAAKAPCCSGLFADRTYCSALTLLACRTTAHANTLCMAKGRGTARDAVHTSLSVISQLTTSDRR